MKKIQSAVRVRDLFVIAPLQLDELSFSDVIRLIKEEELPGRQWFHVELEAKDVAFSLRRMVEAGLVACYPNGQVSTQPVPLPPIPLMEQYWYGLTPTGREWLQRPVPWDYPLQEWGFGSESSSLRAAVQSIRSDPSAWTIAHIDARPSKAKHLANCMSYKSELRKIGQKTRILTHVIELGGMEDAEFLHGHFLPPYEDPQQSLTDETGTIGYEDDLVLDVLTDDVEHGMAILTLLNDDLTIYRKIRGGAEFSPGEVLDSLVRLASRRWVVPFREDRGQLVHTLPEKHIALEEFWFMRSSSA